MRERVSTPHEEIRSDVAAESGLGDLRQHAKVLHEQLDLIRTGTGSLEGIAQVVENANRATRYFSKVREALGLPVSDPEYQLVDQLTQLTETIWHEVQTLQEITKKVESGFDFSGRVLDQTEQTAFKAAAADIVDRLPGTFRELEKIQIESRVSRRNLVKTASRAAQLVMMAGASVGLLGHAKKGEATPERFGAQVTFLQSKGSDVQPSDLVLHEVSGLQRAQSGSEAEGASEVGAEHRPDFGGEGEPGEFEHGKYIAEVTFTDDSTITDSLWTRELVARDDRRRFRTIQRETIQSGTKSQARVVREPVSATPGKRVALMTPIGFGPAEVTVHPDVPFTFDPHRREVTFTGTGSDVVVEYDVVTTQEAFVVAQPKAGRNFRSPEENELVLRVADSSVNAVPRLLDHHLRKFTYVVSSDVQTLVDRMPGMFEEKIAGTRLGDCDALAAYAAGLLNEAGRPALVDVGDLATLGSSEFGGKQKIDAARAHAKLVYFDETSTPQAYEATAATREQYVHVTLLPEDKARLEEFVTAMESEVDVAVLAKQYRAFGDAVVGVLSRPEYDQYLAKSDLEGSEGETLRRVAASTENLRQKLRSELRSPSWGGIGIAALSEIMLMLGGFVGWERLRQRLQIQAEARRQQRGYEVFDEFQNQPEVTSTTAETAESYQQHNFQMVVAMLPHDAARVDAIQQAKNMSAEQLDAYAKALGLVRVFFQDTFGVLQSFRSLTDTAAWDRAVERLRADGVDLETIGREALHLLRDSTLEKKIQAQTSVYATELVGRGKQQLADVAAQLQKSEQAPVEMILKILGGSNIELPHTTTQSKKARKGTPGIESNGPLKYVPGQDPRLVDWAVYARTGELWTRPRELEASKSGSALDIVVECVNANAPELEALSALILYSQKHPQTVQFRSATFVADGRIIGRLEEKTMKKLYEGSFGKTTQGFIETILRKRLEASLTELIPDRKRHQGWNFLAVVRRFPRQLHSASQSVFVGFDRYQDMPTELQSSVLKAKNEKIGYGSMFDQLEKELKQESKKG